MSAIILPMATPTILFLEVDPDDASSILGRYPSADIEPQALKGLDLTARCKGATVISCFIHTQFTAEVLSQLPDLKLLCTRSVGSDHIDTDYCAAHGITVCNVPDYGSHVIAEHVFALLLGTLRHVAEGDRRVEAGMFDYHGLRGMALKGKTIGILGTGKIGRCVAKIAHGFDMRILATDQCRTLELTERYGVKYVDFHELLKESDILTLHIPATPQTQHLIDTQALAGLKKGAVLVNTARGALIDSDALLTALETGTPSWALLDVLEHEENFSVSKKLVSHPRVVATPHIAFYADDSMRNMYEDTFASIDEWQQGKTPERTVKPPQIVCDLSPAGRT